MQGKVEICGVNTSKLKVLKNDETRALLRGLAAGLTDESIGRELGMSERSVHRRIRRLQDLLASRSRFQLGIQAVRRGWL